MIDKAITHKANQSLFYLFLMTQYQLALPQTLNSNLKLQSTYNRGGQCQFFEVKL